MKAHNIEKLIDKEDVKIVLYDKDPDDDYYTLGISNRDYESSLRIRHDNLSFERELESLDIQFDCDEWICYQVVSGREEIKTELEKRGFLVELYNYEH